MNKKIQFLGAFVLMGLLLGMPAGATANPAAEKAALEAAQSWLALVDAGNYAASWEQAASYFKDLVPDKEWAQSLEAVRSPLGKTISRKKLAAKFATSLPGAPDGEYVVIQFATQFENKKSAVETVTPMRDKDGTWRISGFYIK